MKDREYWINLAVIVLALIALMAAALVVAQTEKANAIEPVYTEPTEEGEDFFVWCSDTGGTVVCSDDEGAPTSPPWSTRSMVEPHPTIGQAWVTDSGLVLQ